MHVGSQLTNQVIKEPTLPALKGEVLTTRLAGKWVNWMLFETHLNKTMF